MNKINITTDFEKYKEYFLEENSKLNLISKNDEKFLYEKHIYDSLAIKLFFEKYNYIPETLLDIGTGGGFPSIPIALEYPEIKVTGIDSIKKKTDSINRIITRLELKNIQIIRDRVENLKDTKFDLITSRAVGRLDIIIKYAYPLLKENGYMIFYKSKSAEEEMNEAKNTIRKLHLKIEPAIEYTLPLKDIHTRCLVILRK